MTQFSEGDMQSQPPALISKVTSGVGPRDRPVFDMRPSPGTLPSQIAAGLL